MSEIKKIGLEEAVKLLKSKKIQLLDTRSAKEREEIGYIDGSILIDTSLSDISNEILQLDRDVEYLLYWGSGGRAFAVSEFMKKNGFKNLNSLSGAGHRELKQGLENI